MGSFFACKTHSLPSTHFPWLVPCTGPYFQRAQHLINEHHISCLSPSACGWASTLQAVLAVSQMSSQDAGVTLRTIRPWKWLRRRIGQVGSSQPLHSPDCSPWAVRLSTFQENWIYTHVLLLPPLPTPDIIKNAPFPDDSPTPGSKFCFLHLQLKSFLPLGNRTTSLQDLKEMRTSV